MKLAPFSGGWCLSYVVLWPRDLLVAVQFGTSVVVVTCICGQLTLEYIAEAERRLMAVASARLAQ